MLLPRDYTRCVNSKCPIKENCKRWLQHKLDIKSKEEYYVSVSKFKYNKDGTCDDQIKMNK